MLSLPPNFLKVRFKSCSDHGPRTTHWLGLGLGPRPGRPLVCICIAPDPWPMAVVLLVVVHALTSADELMMLSCFHKYGLEASAVGADSRHR